MNDGTLPPPDTRIVLAGLGGQGVIFATRLIAQAAVRQGWPVVGSETHGMSQRGGSVLSHLKLSRAESPLIRRGTADVLLAFDRDEGVRALPFLRAGGVCVVNAEGGLGYDLDGPLAEASVAVYTLPATSMALAYGSASLVNVIVVGFACGQACLPLPEESLRGAIADLAASQRERNLQAFAAGALAASNALRARAGASSEADAR